jgi:hypothetical protein
VIFKIKREILRVERERKLSIGALADLTDYTTTQ